MKLNDAIQRPTENVAYHLDQYIGLLAPKKIASQTQKPSHLFIRQKLDSSDNPILNQETV